MSKPSTNWAEGLIKHHNPNTDEVLRVIGHILKDLHDGRSLKTAQLAVVYQCLSMSLQTCKTPRPLPENPVNRQLSDTPQTTNIISFPTKRTESK